MIYRQRSSYLSLLNKLRSEGKAMKLIPRGQWPNIIGSIPFNMHHWGRYKPLQHSFIAQWRSCNHEFKSQCSDLAFYCQSMCWELSSLTEHLGVNSWHAVSTDHPAWGFHVSSVNEHIFSGIYVSMTTSFHFSLIYLLVRCNSGQSGLNLATIRSNSIALFSSPI